MVIDGINAAKFKTQYKTAIGTEFPDEMTIILGDVTHRFVKSEIPTRYGTNPNQPFKLYIPEGRDDLVLGNMEVIKEGKEGLSLFLRGREK